MFKKILRLGYGKYPLPCKDFVVYHNFQYVLGIA